MKRWILIVIGVIVIGIIAFFIIKESLKEEAELTFPQTILVENVTDKDVDKIVKAIAHHVLAYDTIHIGLVYVPEQLENVGDIKIRAFIQKNIFKNNTYLIFLAKDLRASEYKFVLSHEMAHLDQYERGDLIQVGLGLEEVVYMGDTINFYEIPYDKRPHEKDAYDEEDVIYQQLDKVLYK